MFFQPHRLFSNLILLFKSEQKEENIKTQQQENNNLIWFLIYFTNRFTLITVYLLLKETKTSEKILARRNISGITME